MPATKKKNNASDKQDYLTTNERLYPQRELIFLLQQNKALTDMISIFYFKIIVDNNHIPSVRLELKLATEANSGSRFECKMAKISL